MTLLMIIKIAALFVLLWFGTVLITALARNQSVHWANYAIPCGAAVVFVLSMGWLS
jgi:inner membrane protein involved in colicin E2 resistance